MKNIINKKHVKRIISTIMVLTLTTITNVIAYAQSFSATTLDEFKEVVKQEIEHRNTNIVINYTGNTTELVNNYKDILDQINNADDYLYWSIRESKYSIKGYAGNVDITLNYSFLATREEEDFVDAKVKEIIPQITNNAMSKKGKIKAIHTYILDNLTYDYSLTYRSTYTALTSGSVVCQAYAMLMYKMLKAVNIPSMIVTGNTPGGLHAWNLVQVDEKWYHIDSTNNDSSNFMELYMATDSKMQSFGFTWNKLEFPAAITMYIDEVSVPMPEPSVTPEPIITAIPTQAPVIPTPIPTNTPEPTDTAIPTQTPTDTTAPTPTPTPVVAPAPVINQKELQYENYAVKYINYAYKNNSYSYLDKAQTYVNKLSDNNLNKESLQADITNAKAKIAEVLDQKNIKAATSALEKAEKYLSDSYLVKAQKAVNILLESKEKQALITRIHEVEKAVELKKIDTATKYVAKLEKSYSTSSYKTTLKYVNALTDGEAKSTLLKRIDVANGIAEKKNIEKAILYIEKLEKNLTTSNLSTATRYVKTLKDGKEKTELLDRVNNAKATIDISVATKAVEKAESKPTSSYIKTAQKYINILTTSNEKVALQKRLDAL